MRFKSSKIRKQLRMTQADLTIVSLFIIILNFNVKLLVTLYVSSFLYDMCIDANGNKKKNKKKVNYRAIQD